MSVASTSSSTAGSSAGSTLSLGSLSRSNLSDPKQRDDFVHKQSRLSSKDKSSAILASFALLSVNVADSSVPGTEGMPKSCQFPRSNWTCPAGYFCLTPDDNSGILNGSSLRSERACSPGFVCPTNTYEPVYCCPGFYCPTPADILPCPVGSYCPLGSVHPFSCSFFAYCPIGTDRAVRYGVIMIFGGLLCIVGLLFMVRRFIVARRNLKYQLRLQRRIYEKHDSDLAADAAKGDLSAAAVPVAQLVTPAKTRSSYLGNEDEDEDDDLTEYYEHSDSQGLFNAQQQPAFPLAGSATPPPAVAAAAADRLKFDIEFRDLSLTLPSGITVMHNVSGKLRAGRTCAVMGPSGAGKSTLFSLLTGKAKRTSGTIMINGAEQELAEYKKLVGFVPQEDVMLRELTVRDVLLHSALMRLPTDWTNKRKKDLVLDTIAFLGLDGVMDSPIGDETQRGISGGQRKRVNIGMELVASPSVLLLDEPTSGLDSVTANEVCTLMRTIARTQNMTVAAVIHSPSSTAFSTFDDLILLGKGGRIIYAGPRDEAVAYFETLGFQLPANENPADFFMDIAQGRALSPKAGTYTPTDLFQCWEQHVLRGDALLGFQIWRRPTVIEGGAVETASQDLSRRTSVAESIRGVTPMLSRQATRRAPPDQEQAGKAASASVRGRGGSSVKQVTGALKYAVADYTNVATSYAADVRDELVQSFRGIFTKDRVRQTPGFFTVYMLCLRRAWLQLYRSPAALIFEQFLHLFLGLFISLAVQDSDYAGLLPKSVCELAPPMLRMSVGCAYAYDQLPTAGMFVCFGSLFAGITNGINTFGPERVVFWRDSSAGMAAMPYFLAKWTADIPRMVLGSVMFMTSLALMLPYRSSFLEIYAVVIGIYFAAYSMGYFLSVVVSRNAVSFAATGFVLMWCMVFGGVIIGIDSVSSSPLLSILSWVWGISPPRWAIEAWYIAESQARPWAELHDKQLLHGYKRENYALAISLVFVIGYAWAVASFLSLKLMHRSKQK
nr:hypothetical protein HK105_000398 [Polyrhizophydium stewartii]